MIFRVDLKHESVSRNNKNVSKTQLIGEAETFGEMEQIAWKHLEENTSTYVSPIIENITPTKIVSVRQDDEENPFIKISAKWESINDNGKVVVHKEEHLFRAKSSEEAIDMFYQDFDKNTFEISKTSVERIWEKIS